MAAKKKKTKQKATWEKAYKGHVLWRGKEKLGKVSLRIAHNLDPREKYQWEAAGRAGFTDDLDKAKAAVEFAVMAADKQMDLFK